MGYKDDFCSPLPQAVFFYFISVHFGKQAEEVTWSRKSLRQLQPLLNCSCLLSPCGLGQCRRKELRSKAALCCCAPLRPSFLNTTQSLAYPPLRCRLKLGVILSCLDSWATGMFFSCLRVSGEDAQIQSPRGIIIFIYSDVTSGIAQAGECHHMTSSSGP